MFSFLSLPTPALRPQARSASLMPHVFSQAFVLSLLFIVSLSLLAARPAQAQYPTGYWAIDPCDVEGNSLSYNNLPLDDKGFYVMRGTEEWAVTHTYPPVIDYILTTSRDTNWYLWNILDAAYPISSLAYPNTGSVYEGLGSRARTGPAEVDASNFYGQNSWWYNVYHQDTNTYDIGTLNGSVTASLTGHLVYYFKVQWQSYSSPTPTEPMPDHINLLLRTNVEAEASISSGASVLNNGLWAVSTATDGLPFGETASASAGLAYDGTLVGAAGPPKVEGYHLVRSVVDPTTHIATVFLDGHLNWQANNPILYGNLDTNNLYRSTVTNGPATARASGSIRAGVKRAEVHLTSPNPTIHPEVGNDSRRQNNQYVYGSIPAGSAHDEGGAYSDPHDLFIPITVTMNGASADDMLWLKSHMEITVTPAIPNASAFDKVVSGNQITLESRYTVFNAAYPGFGDLVTYNGFLAHDLPNHNSDFGNHQVTLKVDGHVIDVANVQTFFNATDNTHPFDISGSTNGVELPNWFYYYSQVYASTGTYWPTPFNLTYSIPPFKTMIGTTTIDNQDQPVFELGANSGPGQLAQAVGIFNFTGIFSYIHVCSHEQGHRNVLQTGGIISPTLNRLETNDGDAVVDSWESLHHLSPHTANTTGYYTSEEPGDSEFLADIQALPVVLSNKSHWVDDWANVGVQYGYNQLNPLPLLPADYTFTFSPTENGLSNFKADHDYPIKTMQDLVNEYPNLVTGLADLSKP